MTTPFDKDLQADRIRGLELDVKHWGRLYRNAVKELFPEDLIRRYKQNLDRAQSALRDAEARPGE